MTSFRYVPYVLYVRCVGWKPRFSYVLVRFYTVAANLFLRATAVPTGTADARISYGNSVCLSVCLSVRLSVCHDPVVYQAQMR